MIEDQLNSSTPLLFQHSHVVSKGPRSLGLLSVQLLRLTLLGSKPPVGLMLKHPPGLRQLLCKNPLSWCPFQGFSGLPGVLLWSSHEFKGSHVMSRRCSMDVSYMSHGCPMWHGNSWLQVIDSFPGVLVHTPSTLRTTASSLSQKVVYTPFQVDSRENKGYEPRIIATD